MRRKPNKEYNHGDKFGDITFIQEDFHEKEVTGFQAVRKAVVECFCGRKFITRITGLENGKVTSCGCRRRDGLIRRVTRHNMSKSSEYKAWESMKARCLYEKSKFYYKYGGRGITICDKWMDFKNFYRDMGNKPDEKYSLERIDVNGNYEPSNCRWATRREQDRNKTNTVYINYNGEKWVLMDLAKKFNIHQQTLKQRVISGMTAEEAISKPIKYNRKVRV